MKERIDYFYSQYSIIYSFTCDFGGLLPHLYSDHDTSIAIMRKQGILSAASLRIFDVRPLPHKVAMRCHSCEFSSDGTIDGFCDSEISGEEDIEVALVNLAVVVSSMYIPKRSVR